MDTRIQLIAASKVPGRSSLSARLIDALDELPVGTAIKIDATGLSRCFASNCHTVANRRGMEVKTRQRDGYFYIWQKEDDTLCADSGSR